MSLFEWVGEEKLPMNCSCIKLTINSCNGTILSGTVVITHFYCNEWVREWGANHYRNGDWSVSCNSARFAYEVDVDRAVADFIKKHIEAFTCICRGICWRKK
ncbi:MAG: hypothetical protein PHD05_06150 [Sphaerochaetaceae bacterium]|nr:hypothetical protein [Sphaerochaetaceae bacterium]